MGTLKPCSSLPVSLTSSFSAQDRGLSPSRGSTHGHERLEARVTELEAHVQIAMDAKDAELKRREQEAATNEKAQDKLKAEIARLHVCPTI